MLGKFIVFDGLDNTGKTTQSKRLAEWLYHQGIVVRWTCEPSMTPLGQHVRTLCKDSSLSAQTKALLFQAVREEHLQQVIRPAIERGEWVICDRFIGSTIAYQGEMGVQLSSIWSTHYAYQQHIPNIDQQFIFLGKLSTDRVQDEMDSYCDTYRTSLTHRFIEYANESEGYGVTTEILYASSAFTADDVTEFVKNAITLACSKGNTNAVKAIVNHN